MDTPSSSGEGFESFDVKLCDAVDKLTKDSVGIRLKLFLIREDLARRGLKMLGRQALRVVYQFYLSTAD
eukprot:2668699-Heterocapsa_arctica.AAC.1